MKISHFHIVQHIGRTFLNHRVKETTARLKGTSHSQRGLGKKLKRNWKLLQKEEAKLNYEKRVWRASFKDYLTESEIVDRLLAACKGLLRIRKEEYIGNKKGWKRKSLEKGRTLSKK